MFGDRDGEVEGCAVGAYDVLCEGNVDVVKDGVVVGEGLGIRLGTGVTRVGIADGNKEEILAVDSEVGELDGFKLGSVVDKNVGDMLGGRVVMREGIVVGDNDDMLVSEGAEVGVLVRLELGAVLGEMVGKLLGVKDGDALGSVVELTIEEGKMVGKLLGSKVGVVVGSTVGNNVLLSLNIR